MGKRRRKVGNKNTKETAGDSRFSVLTDESDTYNPFKGIKKEDVVVKTKAAASNNQSKQKRKNPNNPNLKKDKKIVETFDSDVTFEDIFSSWENGRSLENVKKKNKSNSMKKSSVQGDEDFASVFAEWERSQGVAPKVKKTPPKKSKQYRPTKDFGNLLNEFEGNAGGVKKAKKQDINQILKRRDEDVFTEEKNKQKEKKQTKNSKVREISELPSNYKVIAQSGDEKNKNKKNINNNKTYKFENKNLNKGKDIKNEKTADARNNEDTTNNIKPNTNSKSRIDKIDKIDVGAESTKKVQVPVVSQVKEKIVEPTITSAINKVEAKQVAPALEVKADEIEKIEPAVKQPSEEIKKVEKTVSDVDTAKKDKKCSWNIDEKVTEKYSHSSNDEDAKEKIVEKSKKSEPHKSYSKNSNKNHNGRENHSKREPFVVASSHDSGEELPSKWNFSDIYKAWSKESEEEKAIAEAKRQKDKKDSKGISISYLRSMSPQAELDLHGLTSDIALLRTREFLEKSRAEGLKKVSIITGKGNHSKDGKGVLQEVALSEIRLSGIVREAYNPKAIDGGSGAIWVIFKSKGEKKVYF
jgi:DNA-nicking Smr family endonuclease